MSLLLPNSRPLRAFSSDMSPDIVDIGAFMQTLWRGKWLMMLAACCCIAAGTYYAYLIAKPAYRSTAVVMLDAREAQVVDLESVIGQLTADASVVNTEVEVLKSRNLLGKLASDLRLDLDPEFNRFLQEPGVLDIIKLTLKRRLGLTEPPPPVPADIDAVRQLEASIDGLLNRVSIRNVPQSLVFQITAETGSPEKSALIANRLVDLYILNQLEVKFEATQQATEWLTGRVAELQISLEQAEAQVKTFQAETDLVGPEALAALEIQLKDVRDRIMDTQIAQNIARQRLEALKNAQTPEHQAKILQDLQLDRLLQRIEAPEIQTAFNARLNQVANRLALDGERAGAQITALLRSQSELEEQIKSQSRDLIALQQLTREAEASRLLYEYFLARLKETSAQQGIHQADSRVLSNAVVPTLATSPRRSLILAMCGLFGLTLGAIMVLLRESHSDTYRTGPSLERGTGIPVLGQITNLPGRKRKDAIPYLMTKPTSAAAEALRNLRTSILLSNPKNPPQVILTCSSVPGEGKTTIALALAQNMAVMGKKVLLIEGDMRRRVFSEYFKAGSKAGLGAVLSGQASASDAIFTDSNTGADVLLGDASLKNAADLYSSQAYRDLMVEVRGKYEQIIVDTPPVLIVPDARIIAQQGDAIVFVVKWDSTSKQQVSQALGLFESVNQAVSGLVLNQINPRGMKRYGYGPKSGTYGANGDKYYAS